MVKPGGNLFINSSIVTTEPTRTDIQIIKVPANEIADELGNSKVANLVMAGAYIGYTELLPPEKRFWPRLSRSWAPRDLSSILSTRLRSTVAWRLERLPRSKFLDKEAQALWATPFWGGLFLC